MYCDTGMYDVPVCEGRDEAMASRGQILETKKQPEIVLLKYFYFPPENLSSRCHGFIPTFMYVHVHSCMVSYFISTSIHQVNCK